jgi:hypothetical protein
LIRFNFGILCIGRGLSALQVLISNSAGGYAETNIPTQSNTLAVSLDSFRLFKNQKSVAIIKEKFSKFLNLD